MKRKELSSSRLERLYFNDSTSVRGSKFVRLVSCRHLYVAFQEPLGARNIMRKVRTVRLRKHELHNFLIYNFISAGTSAFRRRFVALTDGRLCFAWCSERNSSRRSVPRRDAVFATSPRVDAELRLIGIDDPPFRSVRATFIIKTNCFTRAADRTGSKHWSLVTETCRLSVGNWNTKWSSSSKCSSSIFQRRTNRSKKASEPSHKNN